MLGGLRELKIGQRRGHRGHAIGIATDVKLVIGTTTSSASFVPLT